MRCLTGSVSLPFAPLVAASSALSTQPSMAIGPYGSSTWFRRHARRRRPCATSAATRFPPSGISRSASVGRPGPTRRSPFNFQALRRLTGPGYFVARPAPDRPEVWVDYNHVPEERPEAWPALRRNEAGLSRFVYGFMVDTLRGVSEHVTIGSAARKGRDMGSWFVLCREL